MKLSLRTRPQPGVAIPRMFGTLQENLRPVHETALKPWGIATPACALVRNDTPFFRFANIPSNTNFPIRFHPRCGVRNLYGISYNPVLFLTFFTVYNTPTFMYNESVRAYRLPGNPVLHTAKAVIFEMEEFTNVC